MKTTEGWTYPCVVAHPNDAETAIAQAAQGTGTVPVYLDEDCKPGLIYWMSSPVVTSEAPRRLQKPEVSINGQLHRRPDPQGLSEACSCGWKPHEAYEWTWAWHVWEELIAAERRSRGTE